MHGAAQQHTCGCVAGALACPHAAWPLHAPPVASPLRPPPAFHDGLLLVLLAVTRVAVAQGTDFFITASADGHIKFWKKQPQGVEFAKHYKARHRMLGL